MSGYANDAQAKRRATLAGVSVERLLINEARGEHWCYRCRVFHPRAAFGADNTRADGRARACREARSRVFKESYQPRPRTRLGPSPHPPRDGDRVQARQRVGLLVRTGRLPHPNTLPCVDCRHVWTGVERRHEYDHHEGYAADKHLVVEPVCSRCHARRTHDRGEIVQTRDEQGRYVSLCRSRGPGGSGVGQAGAMPPAAVPPALARSRAREGVMAGG